MDVEFSNPLQVPIDVSSVCLTCEFDGSNSNKPGKNHYLEFSWHTICQSFELFTELCHFSIVD